MAILSERQQQAAAITRELQKFDGVWVISPLPLDSNSQLRVQILEASCDRNKIFQAIADWGFGTPVFVSMTPRIIGSGMAMASIYEIPIEKERQPIVDNRITGELADSQRKKSNIEVEAVMRYLGMAGKK
jgi:hypothetical protein